MDEAKNYKECILTDLSVIIGKRNYLKKMWVSYLIDIISTMASPNITFQQNLK